MRKPYYRISQGKQLAGVCAGLADRNGKSPNWYRWWFVAAHFFGLPMIAVYFFLWLIYPLDPPATKPE